MRTYATTVSKNECAAWKASFHYRYDYSSWRADSNSVATAAAAHLDGPNKRYLHLLVDARAYTMYIANKYGGGDSEGDSAECSRWVHAYAERVSLDTLSLFRRPINAGIYVDVVGNIYLLITVVPVVSLQVAKVVLNRAKYALRRTKMERAISHLKL